MKFLIVSLFLGLAMLSGCSTSPNLQISEKTIENMYLRGVFTWWEADENFKLYLVNKKLYMASAKLIADGQPYDFKFSDADWTPEYSCGSLHESGQVIDTLKNQLAKCNTSSGNFRFTPAESGIYNFYIDFAVPVSPVVYIRQAN
jgi:uncharacterized protein YceK